MQRTMPIGWLIPFCLFLGFAGAAWPDTNSSPPFIETSSVTVVLGMDASSPETKAAEILHRRLLNRSEVRVQTVTEKEVPKDPGLIVAIGVIDDDGLANDLASDLNVDLPTLPNSTTIHPESYALKTGTLDRQKLVTILGADPRGVLYGVGAFLRSLEYLPDRVVVPQIDVSDKPAFRLRGGTPTGPGSRAREYSNLRPQTRKEFLERMEDLILVGANTIGTDLETVRAYGMQAYFGRKANELRDGFPVEWGANDGRSDRYVCPSIPEARKALLDSFEQWFKEKPFEEIWATKSGDPGGCRCDRCMPWGATYIELVHEIADILHKYHPETKVIATNQDLTNEGNQAILDYLNTHDSSFLHALRYGPAGDEMQTYIRGPVNPRWFEYEGYGPLGNYIKYLHHELPRTTTIVGFTDVTHWMQSQYAVENPDIALAAVYDRRAWNARPRAFHLAAQNIFRYMDGDLYYSEGQHDEFNKWFWHRLLWNPHLTAEGITQEYCEYFFGSSAAEEMSEAIFLMEETLEKPVRGNPGIAKAVEVLDSAGEKIPENYMKVDYRWRIISQKALMDRYIQLLLKRGDELKEKAKPVLAKVEDAKNPRAEMERALEILRGELETPEMKEVLAKATRLGEESNEIVGYRVPGIFIAPKMDVTETMWWEQTVKEALDKGSDDALRNAARKILHYEDPGEGGFHDNLGWPSESPHLVHGETLWGFRQFEGPAKLSHYNLGYSRGDPGLTFSYDGLDSHSQYVVRVAVGTRHREGRPTTLEQGLRADGEIVSDGFEISLDKIGYHEFDIPKEVTGDGQVTLTFTGAEQGSGGTLANEIWLMKKVEMPWTAAR